MEIEHTAAVGYVRVSSEEQARSGLGLDAQAARVRAYCDAHAMELVGVFRDEGISGARMDNRPGLQEALRVAREECCPLVVLTLDRLSRRTRDVLELIEEAGRECWELHSITEHLDTGTPVGKFTATILAGLAQMEREQAGARTRAALAAKRERGERVGAPALGERRTEDGGYETDPEEMLVVDRIVAKSREGKSQRAIAEELEAEGVPTKRGGKWSHVMVGKVLRRVGA